MINMICNHCTDEEMLDFILGKLGNDKKIYVNKCIHECDYCYSQYVGWKSDVLVEPIRQPSSKLKERVLNTYKKQDRIKFEKKRNPLVLTPTIGAMIVAALLFLFFQYESPANKNHLTNTADAAVYELETERTGMKNGYVMIGKQTDAFYFSVDGLQPIANKDYQIWVNGQHDAGIIRVMNGNGQVYVKKRPQEVMEYLLISIEPKGGSPYPNAENSTLIKLKTKY
ncbi:anti-sigma factor domain-containing protein [Lederbergia graminis]|uniref:Anti-sigma factor domain-containing protein n=1 Tax=Lederbergia graminis TaxID=735518 RepID=A0ABW0LFR5_9BACI